jgi:hypothetical protein
MRDACVFIDFAEKILTVDELKGAAEKGPKLQAKPRKFVSLTVRNELDDFRLI